MYLKNGIKYTHKQVVYEIMRELNSAIIPAYFNDDLINAFDFKVVPDTERPESNNIMQSRRAERKRRLDETDWIATANSVTKTEKDRVEAWRWLMRNIFELNAIDFPDLPTINTKPANTTQKVKNIELIKDYKTTDPGWMDFLRNWEKTNYTELKTPIEKLLAAYTGVTLSEIIK